MDRPQLAKNLINDDFFKEEMDRLRQDEINNILNSQPDEQDKREIAYVKINAIQSVLTHFESIANTKLIEQKKWKIL